MRDRSKRSRQLFLAAVVIAPVAAIMSFLSGPQAPPDFAAMCTSGTPFFVVSAFRAQSASNRAPDPRSPAVVVFQDTARDTAHYELATFMDTGAVWGLGYSAAEGAIYTGTYHKRGLPYGPDGPGGIYRIDLATGAIKHFVTVPSAGVAQRGSSMSNGEFGFDHAAAKKVGKTALGDLDLNEDGSELFVMNLDDRHVYRYAVPSGALLGSFYHGAVAETWAKDARPFALAWYDDHLYHGVVNARGIGSEFLAKVYRSNADGSDMIEVMSLPLRYDRDSVNLRDKAFGGQVRWGPWTDNIQDDPLEIEIRRHVPQPMLTDIAFTPDGRMSLALRDRHWDMVTQWVVEARETATVTHGAAVPAPPPKVLEMAYAGLGFGDILYGEPKGDGTFTVNTTPEHFDDTNGMNQDESALGGLSCVADTSMLASTHFGVDKANSDRIVGEEGVFLYDVPSGNKTGHESLHRPGSFQPYTRLLSGSRAWAHGPWFDYVERYEWYRDIGSLGDVEALCEVCAPGEIIPTPTSVTDTPEPPTDTPVVPPTDTPTVTPSNTPTATNTPTDTPTPTPTPGPVFLPILLREQCGTVDVRADIVVIVDVSTTMLRPTRAGRSKLEAVQEAARLFIDRVDLDSSDGHRDQVAIGAFNDKWWLEQDLSSDGAALRRAVAAVSSRVAFGTRLDLALEGALAAVTGPAHDPANTPVVVLLTDGVPDRVPTPVPSGRQEDTVLAAAQRVKDAGVRLYTIGVGDPDATNILDRIDVVLLRAVASRPDMFYLAPDAEELGKIYAEVAYTIHCPASDYWGNR